MVTRGAQLRFNPDGSDPEDWSKPVIPITNGFGYLDMTWDPTEAVWTGGGSGTLLVSSDGGRPGRRIRWAPSSPAISPESASVLMARASSLGIRYVAALVEPNCIPL